MATAYELRECVDSELENRLDEARQELFNLRFQAVTGRLDNMARLGELRKEIARISTIIREREIAEFEGRFADAQPAPHVEREPRPPKVKASAAKDEGAEAAGEDAQATDTTTEDSDE